MLLASVAYVLMLAFAIPLALVFLAIILVAQILGWVWFLPGRALAAVATALIVAFFFSHMAYAQTGAGVAKGVCSPDGMQAIEYVAGAIIASGAYSCLKKAVAKLPRPVQNSLNFVLGDWHQILVAMGILKA